MAGQFHSTVLALFLTACGCGGASKSTLEPAAVTPSASAPAGSGIASAAPTPTASMSLASTPVPKTPDPPVKSECDGVTLELRNARFEGPNRIFFVDAYLKNRGKKPYAITLPGDGSSDGRRNPKLSFDLVPHDQRPADICGMMNPVAPEDFMTLAPGAEKKLEWVHAPQPAHAGTFTLKMTYSNDPTWPLRESIAAPGMADRMKSTIACEVTSAPITVKVP